MKTAQIISLKVYKYRRYELDLPKRKAIELATLNHYQVQLCKAREFENKERVTE